MSSTGEINLEKEYFSEKPSYMFNSKNLKAQIFKYESGLSCIKLENSKGYITMLPYMGQMIWDVIFENRNLTMSSSFSKPVPTELFLNTYGGFLMHCGVIRMGCPSKEDTHKLHGELPVADYQKAKIVIGEDIRGKFIGTTGTFEYNIAFGSHYLAVPLVKLYENSTILEISINIENLSHYPMELMYLAHINLKPIENGRILQSLGWTKDDLKVRDSIPDHVSVPEGYQGFIAKLKEEPSLTRIIKKSDSYNPEIAFFLSKPKTDDKGYAHFLQVHPDGTSDYISYKPEEFDHGTRWFCITDDTQALGLVLPATADAEGYIAEKKKGNFRIIRNKNY
ncbi:MAG: DUF4432 domain-containing protein [Actinobacteria bacterium]|nr:DUF4432 domain-containing protein [Actinomycetota bacterium]